jgi:hypothetical protein
MELLAPRLSLGSDDNSLWSGMVELEILDPGTELAAVGWVRLVTTHCPMHCPHDSLMPVFASIMMSLDNELF